MLEPFIGSIVLFCGNFAPAGWALCNGQLMPINQWAALFSILGTTYGGNGTTNFGLPNLQGRVPIHPGTGQGLSPYTLGQAGGIETVALQIGNMPAHNHSLNGDDTASGKVAPGPNHVIGLSNTDKMYSSNAPNVAMNTRSIGMAGQNQPFSVVQPFQCINYIIALQGIFPSRN